MGHPGCVVESWFFPDHDDDAVMIGGIRRGEFL
jgi:hypothetical protein